jgi:uncharacterized protein (DUF1778 family)
VSLVFRCITMNSSCGETLADRRRFELPAEQWNAFQATLDRPATAKPRLQQLLNEPGLLDAAQPATGTA